MVYCLSRGQFWGDAWALRHRIIAIMISKRNTQIEIIEHLDVRVEVIWTGWTLLHSSNCKRRTIQAVAESVPPPQIV